MTGTAGHSPGFSSSRTCWAGGEATLYETERRQECVVSADRLAPQEKRAEVHMLSIISKTHHSVNSILPWKAGVIGREIGQEIWSASSLSHGNMKNEDKRCPNSDEDTEMEKMYL